MGERFTLLNKSHDFFFKAWLTILMLVVGNIAVFLQMVLSERKKTHSTLWDTYLEIQIAMVDIWKKKDEIE